MKDEFYNYLKNAYWAHVQYGLEKYFSLYKSAYFANEVCIWEFENRLNISDTDDYVIEYQKVYKFNQYFNAEYELPNLLYQTEQEEESKALLYAAAIGDYEQRLKELMNIVGKEKTLSLVDNEGYVKYN